MPSTYRPQARNWCFTLNNPKDDATTLLLAALPKLHYAVWQRERGSCGTEHLQGYIAFKDRTRLSEIRKILHGAHFEIARGSPESNRTYCTKEESRIGEIVEIGDFSQVNRQGNRSDLEELQTAFEAGLTERQYATDLFSIWIRYPKALSAYHESKIKPRETKKKTSLTLLIGTAGTGKSIYAEYLAGLGGDVYRHSLGGFWDGYRGERTVIFEDFRGSSIPYGDFKRVCDRFPLRVGVKGSSCQMAATEFFITTNFQVEEWWDTKVTGSDLSPIYRRITRVLYFPEYRKFHEFSSYRAYAIAVLTPLGENGIRTLPQAQIVPSLVEEEEENLEEDLFAAEEDVQSLQSAPYFSEDEPDLQDYLAETQPYGR